METRTANLFEFINAIVPFDELEKAEIARFVEEKNYPKNFILLENGDVARHIYFMQEGLARTFSINKQGKDITHSFFMEGEFLTVGESFFNQKPSERYSIELLEDCKLQRISYQHMLLLSERIPKMEKVQNKAMLHFLLRATDRIVQLQFQSASERYHTLMEKQPQILQRAPLGHIASYLGFTQETLSRIRARRD
ncbi:Crp/Fnr family transcriptional regulator [Olivibacter sitiensis]|uniref:Crp/Fnr family transcriptional regulator n=1 Tax=Olivibacter sitiensis TaxID=376470 RepID=UPI0003F9F631|nr:Crp/Fnr family transcriptional regulator [Olivibacter sitiensis]